MPASRGSETSAARSTAEWLSVSSHGYGLLETKPGEKAVGTIAVVAHSGKTLGGGLGEFRDELAAAGVDRPVVVRGAEIQDGTEADAQGTRGRRDLVFVWGGDGMVQRCIDALAGSDVTLAIVPAGTANLFASNVGIPKNVRDSGRGRDAR